LKINTPQPDTELASQLYLIEGARLMSRDPRLEPAREASDGVFENFRMLKLLRVVVSRFQTEPKGAECV